MHSKRVANWAKSPSMRAHLQDAKRDEEGLQIKTTSPDGGLRYKWILIMDGMLIPWIH